MQRRAYVKKDGDEAPAESAPAEGTSVSRERPSPASPAALLALAAFLSQWWYNYVLRRVDESGGAQCSRRSGHMTL